MSLNIPRSSAQVGRADGAAVVDRVASEAESLSLVAQVLVRALQNAKDAPALVETASAHAQAAFLAADKVFAQLRGEPLEGTALATAQEAFATVKASVASVAEATEQARIPAGARAVELPSSIYFQKDALEHLVERANELGTAVTAKWNGRELMVARPGDDAQQLSNQMRQAQFQAANYPDRAPVSAAEAAKNTLGRAVTAAEARQAYDELRRTPPRKTPELLAEFKKYDRHPLRAAVDSLQHPGEIAALVRHLFENAGDLGLKRPDGTEARGDEATALVHQQLASLVARGENQSFTADTWAKVLAEHEPS